ncbi:chemotaxis protein CheA [Paracoccus aurantiacus]|uniref:Chemotaxis protein CheA n=1 Tax=Paracoccus aurantiacus TaxID=2599412 RepID=A0A5C6S9Q5_9RHOB|nr:chemotaxis protein CheA [Paracoccus aurantiacus]TXB71114.1 chemotaxis protein CheA [Paracoccus aurantiacus]
MTTDPMAEIRTSFFAECDELLESLQDALNLMDEGEHDSETINVVFRAVHSIKGGAGAFGLDALVSFAHQYETVMDEVRSGRLVPDASAIKLFFRAADMLQDIVRTTRDEQHPPPGIEDMLALLKALLHEDAQELDEPVAFTPLGLSLEFDLGAPAIDVAPAEIDDDFGWTITFTPNAGLYASGNEALLILRSLSNLGHCVIRCLVPEDLPPPDESNAETPLLSWRIILEEDVPESDIRQVFDFVNDVCQLQISPRKVIDDLAPTRPERISPTAEAALPPVGSTSAKKPAGDDACPISSAASKVSLVPHPRPARPVDTNAHEPATMVRVDMEKIDRLVNLIGELVINQAMLAQSVETAGMSQQSDIMAGLESFMTLTRDIKESVMTIRAQPVKSLFQRMARIVREASASVEKEVRLKSVGEYTEVDKTVIERLADPLTQMIRNAVDHGLERPDVRRAASKPPEGQITLSASHRAGRVLIEIEDDGAGIDRPKVRDIAIQKRLIAPDASLTDAEIDQLLFLPGFSTATEVSALSGRGVGMDVVKAAITSLGGRITTTSVPGQGTKFSISLPLTLAVLDGMVVQAAGQTLVVPLSAIIETAKLEEQNIHRLSASGMMMRFRQELVPLFDLGQKLGFRDMRDIAAAGIVLLTVQEDGRRAALIVDAIMEQRQVVIKGLGQTCGHIPGVAAATILGDGQIALILDPGDLVWGGASSPHFDTKAG